VRYAWGLAPGVRSVSTARENRLPSAAARNRPGVAVPGLSVMVTSGKETCPGWSVGPDRSEDETAMAWLTAHWNDAASASPSAFPLASYSASPMAGGVCAGAATVSAPVLLLAGPFQPAVSGSPRLPSAWVGRYSTLLILLASDSRSCGAV